MWIMKILLVVVCFALVQSEAPIPITQRFPGIIYGNGTLTSKVKLEAFLDPVCGACVRNWPVLKRVAAHYGDKVALVVNPYALGYFRNSFMIDETIYLVNDKAPTKVFAYLDALFKNVAKLSNSATYRKSDYEVLRIIADIGSAATGIAREVFIKDYLKYYGPARSTWKYGARRGVAGTPWFYVNDVDLTPEKIPDFQGWLKILDPLLK